MPEVLGLLMRWFHISSMAVLVGGLIYARLAMTPASEALAPEGRDALGERAAAAFRPLAFAAMTGLIVSGLYNVISTPGHSTRYHAWLAVKLLLSAHVFATTLLIVQPNRQRRPRLMMSACVSGLIVILIAAYLKRIF
jgi:cytochrome bd-type quinol oxidase subunit 2